MKITFLVTDISKSITVVCPRISLYTRRLQKASLRRAPLFARWQNSASKYFRLHTRAGPTESSEKRTIRELKRNLRSANDAGAIPEWPDES
jgi:hypothetical protein